MQFFKTKVITSNVHPETGLDSIPYPATVSEFEVQAFLYFELKARGFDVRGEVSSTLCSSRLDLVIFKERKPILVIEVKKELTGAKARHSQRKNIRRQTKQYRNLLVPLAIIVGMQQAEKFLNSDLLALAE